MGSSESYPGLVATFLLGLASVRVAPEGTLIAMEGPSDLSRKQRTGGPRFVTEVCQQVARGLPSEVLISPSQFLFPFLARTRIDGAQQVVVMGVNTVTYTVGDIIRKNFAACLG